MPDGVALPQWQSHKKVCADKIINEYQDDARESFGPEDSGITWGLACGGRVAVSKQLLGRLPEGVDAISGYYVRYADGFESWSPAKAFEEGYTRI